MEIKTHRQPLYYHPGTGDAPRLTLGAASTALHGAGSAKGASAGNKCNLRPP